MHQKTNENALGKTLNVSEKWQTLSMYLSDLSTLSHIIMVNQISVGSKVIGMFTLLKSGLLEM